MTTYVEELQNEIERVTLKGNADKQTIRRLASIIFRMDQRILALEGKPVQEVVTPKVEEQAPVVKRGGVKPVKTPDEVSVENE